MTETVTLDEYRDVIALARALVVAWRDADADAGAGAGADGPLDGSRIAWFDRCRDDAVVKYNALARYLSSPNPDMLATGLDGLRGVSRGMAEKCEWEKLAPAAEDPFRVFARTIRALWPKFPDNGTPEAAEAEPLYRLLAGEFEPVAPRLG